MLTYRFTVILEDWIDDLDAVNAFYGVADDASVENYDGTTHVNFDREGQALEDTLRSALIDVQTLGSAVRSITLEPDCLTPAASA